MEKKANRHESIKAKQRELSLPYSDAKPSEVTDVYWICAMRKKGRYSKATQRSGKYRYNPETKTLTSLTKTTLRSGKWLIFVNMNDIDEVWDKIKKATEEGKLGSSAKVATARPNPNATNPETKVICVYTYDWTDEKDVKRIREELRKLGITSKIPYKTDEDTLGGKHRITGHRRISKYYE